MPDSGIRGLETRTIITDRKLNRILQNIQGDMNRNT
jgi:hypothetical protein